MTAITQPNVMAWLYELISLYPMCECGIDLTATNWLVAGMNSVHLVGCDG